MGQVCAKHNEYYEDRCRWCEAPETDAVYEYDTSEARALLSGFLASTSPAAYDERLRRAMLPPNDGHGAFE